MPKVSVLVPTFNAQHHIEATMRSLMAQSLEDIELCVLDDASTDDTVDIVRGLRDPRIRLNVNPVNLGLPANLNIGLAMARAPYVARIDHDDFALPLRLATQAAFLDANPDITVVGSWIEHTGEETGVVELPTEDAIIKARFLCGETYLANPSTLWRREFVERNRIRYDPNLYVVDDLGFWFDCMLHGARFANLPQVLLQYRIHAHMTSRNLDVARLFESKKRVYSRLLPVYFPALNARETELLLELFHFDDANVARGVAYAEELHQTVGAALRDVSDAFGQDVEEVRRVLARLLNRRRTQWLALELLTDAEFPALDRRFYQTHQAAVAGQATHDGDSRACFDAAPAYCVKHDSYFQVYDTLFGPYRGRPVTFVEVGVFNGGSLFMWRQFFGPLARIIGIDLNPAAKRWEAAGFEIVIGDQASPSFWESFFTAKGPVDILLDDGGHMNHQQIVTSHHALQHIADGGLLVVEDVHTSYFENFNSRPEHSFMAYARHMADRVNSRCPEVGQATGLTEPRVWSVAFFESIVAFHIDARRCHNSTWIANQGLRTVNEDWRHVGISGNAVPDLTPYFGGGGGGGGATKPT
ncbi:MAG TPA: glycosyltransferase [Burkholderiaceae bacterium]|nr:glycosyltransferase [Burkholderiaceae bacterium]